MSVRGLRWLGLVAALPALAGCGRQSTRVPVAKSANSPSIVVVGPRDEDRDRERIKRPLAENDRDALARADVGYYMDVLQGRLQQVAGTRIVSAHRNDRRSIGLKLESDFEPGSARIDPGIDGILAPLSKVLVEYRKTLISVRMCVNASDATDPKLSQQRALAVAHYLVDAGVAARRIVIVRFDPLTALGAKADQYDCSRCEIRLEPILRAAEANR